VTFTTRPDSVDEQNEPAADISAVEYQQPSPERFGHGRVVVDPVRLQRDVPPVLGAGAARRGRQRTPIWVFLDRRGRGGASRILEPQYDVLFERQATTPLGRAGKWPRRTCQSSDCEMTVTLKKPSGQ